MNVIRNGMLALFITLASTHSSVAWDGQDVETGEGVEIEKGQLVREGEAIEFFDAKTGEYHEGEVSGITRSGGTVELEVEDSTTGETRTLEMESE
jgi:hypothetical protein